MRARSMPYVDPRTGNITLRSTPSGVPLGPAPLRSRPILRRGFGDIPATTGAAGPLVSPYYENEVWNPPGISGQTTAAAASTSTSPTSNPSATGYLPLSAPFGESDRGWTNPTTFSSVPINASTNISVPVLSQNYQRNALIIQNGSLATVSGDVAPTLYVNFNAQPQVGSALALPPGVGVVFDIICPRDSVYIAFGPFVNTGGSVVIQGCVLTGTYAP